MADPKDHEAARKKANRGVWVILALAAIFFSFVVLLLLGGADRPDRGTEAAEELFVIPSSLRLRAEPSLRSAILTTLERGERLEEVSAEGSWVQVRRQDGTVGWAERSYLEAKTEHERRVARRNSIRLLPPLHGNVERKAPVYAGPGIFYPIIGELEPGKEVTVYTRDHDLYAVDLGGEVGYAEVDAIDLSTAGASLFEVAATDDQAPDEIGGEPDQVAGVPEPFPPFPGEPDVPVFTPPIAEPEPAPPVEQPAPRPRGGVYPGVPPGGTDPVVIRRAIPRYPASARGNGVEGTAVVRAVVRRNGRVGSVEILRDPGMGLGEAAADAVRRWRFRPATYQGEPIDVYYNVTINFRLSD